MAFIPGKENTAADKESRAINLDTEWKLDPTALSHALSRLQAHPDIDLFASRTNKQFDRCLSLTGRIQTPYAVAGLSLCWRDLDFYAFPPFSVMSQVLGKVKRQGAMGVVVVPRWTTQVWYPLLTRLLIADPVLLPSNAGLLTLPSQPAKKHPLLPQLRLMVCRLSGRGTRDGVSPTLRSSLSGTFLQGCRKPVLKSLGFS